MAALEETQTETTSRKVIDWKAVKRERKEGVRVAELAEKYGVTAAAIYSHLASKKTQQRRKVVHTAEVTEAPVQLADVEVAGEQVLNALWSRLSLVEKVDAIGAVIRRTQHGD